MGKVQRLRCFLQGPACIQVVPTHYEKMQTQSEEGNSRREVLLAAQECQWGIPATNTPRGPGTHGCSIPSLLCLEALSLADRSWLLASSKGTPQSRDGVP